MKIIRAKFSLKPTLENGLHAKYANVLAQEVHEVLLPCSHKFLSESICLLILADLKVS